MIERLVLKNFESHTNTTIDFNGGISVLKGSSNAGKSSILRALRLVILNEPKSDKYINFNANECSVTLYINGHVIERVRAKNNKKNLYIVDGKELKAFGQSVPQEVTDIIGMSNINFEWQFDTRPFLLAETGGYISQKINEIMNLSLIDSSQKAVDSKKRGVKKEIDSETIRKTNQKEKLKNYEYLDSMGEEIDDIVRDSAYVDTLVKKQNDIMDGVTSYNSIISTINSLDVVNSSELDEIEKINKGINDLSKSHNQILDSIESQGIAQTMINYLKIVDVDDLTDDVSFIKNKEIEREDINILRNEIIDSTSEIEKIFTYSDRNIDRINAGIAEYENNVTLHNEMTKFLFNFNELMLNMESTDRELLKLKKEYAEIAPDFCPLCGHEMSKEL